MAGVSANVRLTTETRDTLRALKVDNETYEDVVRRLICEAGYEDTLRRAILATQEHAGNAGAEAQWR